MDKKELQVKVEEEVRERAEELAKAEVRRLTLARSRAKALYHRSKARIEELDKAIGEVKVEDYLEEALRDVSLVSPFEEALRLLRG